MQLNKIYHQDCLKGIKEIDDNSVKLIVTDPPYCTGITHNGNSSTFQELLLLRPFFESLLKEYKRVLSDDGEIYFFCDFKSYPFYYPLFIEILNVRNMIVWDKISGPGNFYGYGHELIIYASMNSRVRKKGMNVWRMNAFNNLALKKIEGEKVHPTQKTLEIIERIILEGSQEGDLVLDTFSGSGTTAVACKKLNRNFIAFEVNKNYHEISEKRLNNT